MLPRFLSGTFLIHYLFIYLFNHSFVVLVCVVCVFVLRPLLFPSRWGRTQTLSSECKINHADFTDWIFLPSNLKEEIRSNPEARSANN